MSNLGLERYLGGRGIALHRTPVGDRYVVEKHARRGFNLGGEQSGHIILTDYATTGDGLIAALQVLAVIVDRGPAGQRDRPRSSALPAAAQKPAGDGRDQAARCDPWSRRPSAPARHALVGTGRLLIRKSGTEPVIRVMAEGEDEVLVLQVVDEIARAIEVAGRG